MSYQQTQNVWQSLGSHVFGVLTLVLLNAVVSHGQEFDFQLEFSDDSKYSDASQYGDASEYLEAPQYSDGATYGDQFQSVGQLDGGQALYDDQTQYGGQPQYAEQVPLSEPTFSAQSMQTFNTGASYVSEAIEGDTLGAPRSREPEFTKFACGVDEFSGTGLEPRWANSRLIPWENYSYGEYIGPSRTPHVPNYRLRVDDQIEFVFQVTRNNAGQGYRFSPGDVIRITSPVDERLNQAARESGVTIMPDGSISLDLIGTVQIAGRTAQEVKAELDMRYSRYYETKPQINVAGITIGTRLRDFLDSIDARAGAGGQSRQVNVNPDGTIRLPLAGTVGVVGLSLDELEREINMRYGQQIQGLRVTPILTQRAPRFVYVAGEVETPGRFELNGPTSAMQAIALAGGWNVGGNLRQIVVFRRDQNWRLMALKLDLAGGLFGKRPIPSDEIWLRDSDIILVPKTPILRLADAVELYFSRTLYGIFPSELGVFDGQSIGGGGGGQ